ncbi:MAG: Nif3-like dinuclear metal center hexameric protein [Lachnospiraceae bacterium]|nr:Nif3-like dinuclear metal center hexameric protein [Lachnospiraceae bacterium]
MKLKDVMIKLEELSPQAMAEDWDNSGLMCGRGDSEISSVLLAVDATDEVIEEAVLSGADLLLTHHPLIFKGIKSVTEDHLTGRRLLKLIQADVACYAMHTNFDVIGMADEAADRLGLQDPEVLQVTFEDSLSKEGIGRCGKLKTPMSLKECAELVKEVFLIDSVRVYGDLKAKISRVAISPGSGKHMSEYALRCGAEVLITGDIDHHEGTDAVALGLNIIDAGHFGLEKIFVGYLKDYFMKEMPEIEVSAASQKEPFITV